MLIKVFKMKGYLLYAETLEINGDYKQAIEYLKEIRPNDLTNISAEENHIYVKINIFILDEIFVTFRTVVLC